MPYYRRRTIERPLGRAAREFPAVLLTGPRQSGKSTTLKHLFARSHRYVSLEPPDVAAAATADPRGFLVAHPPPVILDEIQYAPTLLPYVKELIDADRDRAGRFLLTGSQMLGLHTRVTESLAGRVAVLHLLPFTERERAGRPLAPLSVLATSRTRYRRRPMGDVWARLLRGGYPDPALHPKRDAWLWHSSYVQTYLERDVRTLRQIGDLGEFQRFVRALAARSAQLLNLTDLARELGIAVNTAKAWLSVLEATFQIFVLRPYHANLTKRLVKTPKIYFLDTGTLCYLVGLRTAEHARQGPMAGPLFETAVVSEVVRSLWHQGIDPRLFFWRTATGQEVDLLIERGQTLVPIEIKASATVRQDMRAGIDWLGRDLGDRLAPGAVVFAGTEWVPLGRDVKAIPFNDL